jgi:hypothetical protein
MGSSGGSGGGSATLPYAWFQNANDLMVPSGVWTPLPWQVYQSDPYELNPRLEAATTTIAAGSNGAALPQGTINVASTAAFASAGYLVITGPPGANIDTVISYTGKTATTFTGCNSAYRGVGVGTGTGTLATGQTVAQGNVEQTATGGLYLGMFVCEVSFDSIPTTNYCGLRLRQVDNFFNFAVATQHQPGMNISKANGGQHVQMAVQPGENGTSTLRLEAYQNSGSAKAIIKDLIQSPSLMQVWLTADHA